MSDIAVVGSGYVGLVTGTCLSHVGHNVTCLDIDEEKIERLRRGIIPIYEPGLNELLDEGIRNQNLSFTTHVEEAIPGREFVFIAVQTPGASNGEADLMALTKAVRTIIPYLAEGSVIIQKSTAPVGTASRLEEMLASKNGHSRHVVSNPEFLREGSAVQDFLQPDRVIVGASDADVASRVEKLYAFAEGPILRTTHNSAEMIKYASNCFLATKISFMNEVAQICEALSVDVTSVAEGMGMDPRIGPDFLHAGLGWGGSCLPKDVAALTHVARSSDVNPQLLEAVQEVNNGQRRLTAKKLQRFIGDLNGKVIGLLGLAFKPGTDDLRSAPSLQLLDLLLDEGAIVKAHDPVAMEGVRRLDYAIELCEDPYSVADGADGLVLVTEWREYKELDMASIYGRMRRPVLIDGRNIWDAPAMQALGFEYSGFGVTVGGTGSASAGNGAYVADDSRLSSHDGAVE